MDDIKRIAMLRSILLKHDYQIRETDGRLEVYDVVMDPNGQDVNEWVDVTDWGVKALYFWMGY